ncbi:MAG: hypothetical protein WCA44_16200 [Acidobacteriaceae bacterium]
MERILKSIVKYGSRALLLALPGALLLPAAYADPCTLQAQMTPAQRQQYEQAARTLIGEVQSGDFTGLRNDTLAAVAADFGGIERSAQALQPLIQQAGITVEDLIAFEAGGQGQGAQFFCTPTGSTMTIVLNFPSLPQGHYALAIVYATGVEKPQQISLILAQGPQGQWQLAGFFAKPLMLAGQDGVWYWKQARQYAQSHNQWAAWFYYQIAGNLVEPVNFLSSPNLDKLHDEAQKVQPSNLPGQQPTTFNANGESFQITRVDTSTELGPLDFVIHYTPDAQEAAELRDPTQARHQVVNLMAGILAVHPGLRHAFHGLWVYADSNGATLFALELPMDQIPGGPAGGNAAGE